MAANEAENRPRPRQATAAKSRFRQTSFPVAQAVRSPRLLTGEPINVFIEEALLSESAKQADDVVIASAGIETIGVRQPKQRGPQPRQKKLKRRAADNRRLQRALQKNVIGDFRKTATVQPVVIFG
jgi:hypothetical protein